MKIALAPLALLLALTLTLAAVRLAKADDDHDRARAALEAGQVLPLNVLLDRIERTRPGQVMEVELETEDGRWIYEVKLLERNGQLSKLKVDARTGQVLRVKIKGTKPAQPEASAASPPQ